MPTAPVNILLVEDNDIDVETVERAFHKYKVANPVTVAVDGVEALQILRGEGGHDKFPRPYIILLDLNLPRMNGVELLEELRKDDELRDSVVFVLTTSNSPEDKSATYNLNIAGYMVKTEIGRDFLGLAEMLDCYWRIVELPIPHE
jgi:CheY-like chemotaxis protein